MDKVSSHAGTLTCFVSWFTKRLPGPRPQLHQRIFLSEQSCSSMHQPLLLYQTSWSSTWVHACSINPLSVHCISALSLVALSSVSAWYCDLSLSLIPFCSVCLCWLLACCQPLKCTLGLHWSNNFTLSTDYRTLTQAICWCWDTSALFSPKFKICVLKRECRGSRKLQQYIMANVKL